MFSFLRFLVIVAILVVGIGLWRGWFTFSKPQPEAQGGKVDIRVSVDENKLKSDLGKVERKLGQETQQLQNRSGSK
jgi:hypothetical protein